MKKYLYFFISSLSLSGSVGRPGSRVGRLWQTDGRTDGQTDRWIKKTSKERWQDKTSNLGIYWFSKYVININISDLWMKVRERNNIWGNIVVFSVNVHPFGNYPVEFLCFEFPWSHCCCCCCCYYAIKTVKILIFRKLKKVFMKISK